MRRFVQPRRRSLSRRIVVRTESKNTAGWKLFFYYHRQKIVGVIIITALIYLFFFYNRAPITTVTFSQETYNRLENNDIFTSISKELIGKGYYKEKYSNRGEFTITQKKLFPIIKDINIISFNKGTLTVDISYNNPDFIAESADGNKRYIYHNTFIGYVSGASLGSTGYIVSIALPQDAISTYSGGVFRGTSSQDLIKIIKQISIILPAQNMTLLYYPGWEKLLISFDKQSYTISLDQKKMGHMFEEWKNIIPYMPTLDQFHADLSDPDRIIIKQ